MNIHLKHAKLIFVFFFNDTATTEIYTLSLHDALPIYDAHRPVGIDLVPQQLQQPVAADAAVVVVSAVGDDDHAVDRVRVVDRKSTRLNSSHANISYAVFCLKKKKKESTNHI